MLVCNIDEVIVVDRPPCMPCAGSRGRGWSNDMVIAPLVRPYHILIFVLALLLPRYAYKHKGYKMALQTWMGFDGLVQDSFFGA